MGKLIDLTGQRFGFWIVKKRGANSISGHTQWLCKCECNNEKLVTTNSLRTGNSTSCGCNHTPDLIGKKFKNLKVINLSFSEDKTRRYWECKCKCGNTIVVSTYELRQNIITSCGHKHNDVKTTNEEARKTYNEEIAKKYSNLRLKNAELIKKTILLIEINNSLQKRSLANKTKDHDFYEHQHNISNLSLIV